MKRFVILFCLVLAVGLGVFFLNSQNSNFSKHFQSAFEANLIDQNIENSAIDFLRSPSWDGDWVPHTPKEKDMFAFIARGVFGMRRGFDISPDMSNLEKRDLRAREIHLLENTEYPSIIAAVGLHYYSGPGSLPTVAFINLDGANFGTLKKVQKDLLSLLGEEGKQFKEIIDLEDRNGFEEVRTSKIESTKPRGEVWPVAFENLPFIQSITYVEILNVDNLEHFWRKSCNACDDFPSKADILIIEQDGTY